MVKGSKVPPSGQNRAMTQPTYLDNSAGLRMQTRKRQMPFTSHGKQGLSSTVLIVLTPYQKIHRQRMHPLNQMQGQLIPHRLTGITSLRSLQDGLPKRHEPSVILLNLYSYLPWALLTDNRKHPRLTRAVLLHLPPLDFLVAHIGNPVAPANVPVALDRPVVINRNREPLGHPLNRNREPLGRPFNRNREPLGRPLNRNREPLGRPLNQM
jgi:hypothetical protein